MSDSKKRRMSMLDNLAQGAASGPPSMMSNNRALRTARDTVESHRIWDLDPDQILDDRAADRMDPQDVADLRMSIEAVGRPCPSWFAAIPLSQTAICWSMGAGGWKLCADRTASPRSAR